MINVIVLWQTVYTQAALDHLPANGQPLDPAAIARLSTLGHPTINLDGRYRTTSRPPPGFDLCGRAGSGSCTNPRHRPTTEPSRRPSSRALLTVTGDGACTHPTRPLTIGWRRCWCWLPRRASGGSLPREVSGQRTSAGDHVHRCRRPRAPCTLAPPGPVCRRSGRCWLGQRPGDGQEL